METGIADRSIAAKGQVHGVGTALDPFRKLAVLKAAYQRTVAVRAIVDIHKVVVGLNAEAMKENERNGSKWIFFFFRCKGIKSWMVVGIKLS